MRRIVLFIILVGLALIPAIVAAQGAPEQIGIALDRLSAEVNRTVTLNDLSNWLWGQDMYPDTSLGCPQPNVDYSQVATQGYTFTLTYEGVTYDYRVSADGRNAFLCSSVSEEDLASATPTPVAPEAIDSSVICLEPEPGIVYLPSRLATDIQVRVVAGPPIVQRGGPSNNDAVVGEIPPSAIVAVEAGPVCADGQLWWQLNYDGQIGWTTEGQDEIYTLEVVPSRTLPVGLSPIAPANVAQLMELSQSQNNVGGALATSPAGTTVAVAGGAGTGGVWLYDLAVLDMPPRLLPGKSLVNGLQYAPSGDLILIGDAGGGVRLWSPESGTTQVERWFDQGYEGQTTAIAYAPDGRTVASVGDVAVTNAPVDRNNAILLWDIETVSQKFALGGHTATVNALAFSPDGTLLVSASDDNSVRLWNPANGSSVAVLEGHTAPVEALAFSPDGTRLVSADSSGAIIAWDVAARAQLQVLQAAGTTTFALAFSPDGALLASAGGDPVTADFDIHLWDINGEQEIARLVGHTASVRDLGFSADGTVLVSVSDDKTVRFWGAGAAG